MLHFNVRWLYIFGNPYKFITFINKWIFHVVFFLRNTGKDFDMQFYYSIYALYESSSLSRQFYGYLLGERQLQNIALSVQVFGVCHEG